MLRNKRFPLLAVLFLLSAGAGFADVKLASVFGDHMVLQQGVLLPFWGVANPGESVSITLGQTTKSTTAGGDGKWRIEFEPMKAGGPYDIGVTGQNAFLLKDIYVGEVWLGSGQSNMDMTVAAEDRYWCGVTNEQAEVASAQYPQIRMFKTKLNMTDTPQTQAGGQWVVTTPETVKKYSATAYFFARELQEKLHVTIGIIDSSFGVSTAQAWISEEALGKNKDFADLLAAYSKAKADFAANGAAKTQKYEEAMKAWTHEAAKAASEGKFLPKGPNWATRTRISTIPAFSTTA